MFFTHLYVAIKMFSFILKHLACATLYDENFIVVTIDQMKTIDLTDAILPVFSSHLFDFNASIVRNIMGIQHIGAQFFSPQDSGKE